MSSSRVPLAGLVGLACLAPGLVSAAEATKVVVLPIQAESPAATEASAIYSDYIAVVVRELGYETVSASDIRAQIQLSQARRLLGCTGGDCVATAEALQLQLQGDELVNSSLVRTSSSGAYQVVMARLDAATGVALSRFEGRAGTDAALRQTFRRGARVLFGREVSPDAVGALLLQTEVPGVLAELDGSVLGRTPIVREKVPAGDHRVVFTSSTARVAREVFVEPGSVTRVRISMDHPPKTLHVFSEPPGAQIYLDGELRGVSPFVVEDYTGLRAELRATKSGYRPTEVSVDLRENADTNEPVVVLTDLRKAWPVAIGAMAGVTFDALTADQGVAFSAELTVDPVPALQVGVGFATPVAVYGSLRIYPVRDVFDLGFVARLAGVQTGGDAVPAELRRWEAAVMGGLVLGTTAETPLGHIGALVEAGPSFLLSRPDQITVPVTVSGQWRFQ